MKAPWRLRFILFGGRDEDDGFRWDFGDRWAMATPGWWYHFFTRQLSCGCTERKIVHRITLFRFPCEIHMPYLKDLQDDGS